MTGKIDSILKDYILKNSLGVYIDLEKSEFDNEKYQVLVLRRPSINMKNFLSTLWEFKSATVLLIYNKYSRTVSCVELRFSYLLPGLYPETKFDLSYFDSFKICGEQIIVLETSLINGPGSGYCLNAAIFNVDGKLLSAWSTIDDSKNKKVSVCYFKEVGDGRWFLKFDVIKKRKTTKKFLVFLSKGDSQWYLLVSRVDNIEDRGSIIQISDTKLNTWFSDISLKPQFFTLVSDNQFCAFFLYKYGEGDVYKKISDITTDTKIVRFRVNDEQEKIKRLDVLTHKFCVYFENESDFLSITPSRDIRTSLTFEL